MGDDHQDFDLGALSEQIQDAMQGAGTGAQGLDVAALQQQIADAVDAGNVSIDLEGADLGAQLAGTGVDAATVEAKLPGAIADALADPSTMEGITVDEGAPQLLGGVSGITLDGSPAPSFEVRFDRDSYTPGDVVRGTLVAREDVKGKELRVELAYVQHSPNYVDDNVIATAEAHKGGASAGAEIPFALELPRDALPNWDPAGLAAAQAGGSGTGLSLGALGALGSGGVANLGRAVWSIVVTAKRRAMKTDDVERHPVPVDEDPASWRGPDPTVAPEIESSRKAKRWDVDIVGIDPWSPRRGEAVGVDLAIGSPTDERDGLRIGLVCEVHYDIATQSTSTDNETGSTTTSTRQTTEMEVVHEEWQTPDPSWNIPEGERFTSRTVVNGVQIEFYDADPTEEAEFGTEGPTNRSFPAQAPPFEWIRTSEILVDGHLYYRSINTIVVSGDTDECEFEGASLEEEWFDPPPGPPGPPDPNGGSGGAGGAGGSEPARAVGATPRLTG